MTINLPREVTVPLYFLWLGRTGPGMTAAQIDYVAKADFPGTFSLSTLGVASGFSDIARRFSRVNAAAYLASAGLANETSQDVFQITRHGIAVWEAAVQQGSDEQGHLVVDPEEPFDYLSLVTMAADLPDLIVIDPYFHPEDLLEMTESIPRLTIVTAHNRVARVARYGKSELAAKPRKLAFQVAIAALPTPEEQRVVYVDASRIHDRVFLGSNGRGYLVGGSYKSKKLTIAMPLPEDYVREQHANALKLIREGEQLKADSGNMVATKSAEPPVSP